MPDFLLEIGTEEIPDWMIDGALADLRDKFENACASLGGDAVRVEGTPRRLVLSVTGMLARTPDTQSIVLGPYLSAGEKAAEGFARKNNTTVALLARTSDSKGERYIVHQHVEGRSAQSVLSEELPRTIAAVYFPKTMSWTGKGGPRFIRPIRWLVALLDADVVPFELAGVQAGDLTWGHRILGSRAPVKVTTANYRERLRNEFVILSKEERRDRIASALPANVNRDEALLGTLVYLTEYPSTVCGTFDPQFLTLPGEILSTVMRHHQRYFSMRSGNGALVPEFAAVTNTDGDPDGLIRRGNERVLRARFNDARFFWESDQRRTLAERVNDLEKVVWQAKLGSYRDKTERIAALAEELAGDLGGERAIAKRAALLSKCDLTTDMVKEFTELQGIVGGLYARAQGEPEPVALAIYDQYRPNSMEDGIPQTREGQLLALADKLDTLRESFAIGLVPTGSKDPFALRRAAQGVVRIAIEAPLDLQLRRYLGGQEPLRNFFDERLAFYLREKEFAYDEVNAVLAVPMGGLHDLWLRAGALREVRRTPDFEPLAASFKRIKNLLRQAKVETAMMVDSELMAGGPERDLFDAFERVRIAVSGMRSYRERLASIAGLRPQVDRFFDKILVNDPDAAIRQNRLALLSNLLYEFTTVADFAELVTEGAGA